MKSDSNADQMRWGYREHASWGKEVDVVELKGYELFAVLSGREGWLSWYCSQGSRRMLTSGSASAKAQRNRGHQWLHGSFIQLRGLLPFCPCTRISRSRFLHHPKLHN